MTQAASITTTKSSSRTSKSATTSVPTQDAIQRRAFEIYLSRGANGGTDLEDWLQAERELTTVNTTTARRTPRS